MTQSENKNRWNELFSEDVMQVMPNEIKRLPICAPFKFFLREKSLNFD